MRGRMEKGEQQANPGPRIPGFAGRGPLEELAFGDKGLLSVDALFEVTIQFANEKREHHELILKAERAINEIYGRFEESQRVRFLSKLYDKFAERYDIHMGSETGHYRAIKRVLGYAEPYLELPIIDLSAGTGEPMMFALENMGSKGFRGADNGLTYQIHVNEISAKMLGIAECKLGRVPKVGFTDYSALDLPEHLKGRFRTVLCSQTFHIISEEDKLRYVSAIREALVTGGHAIVMEEDPFRITPTPSIEPVSLFLRSVVAPIKHRGTLIAYFENNGFTRLEDRAVSPIDAEHSMRLHIFEKSG